MLYKISAIVPAYNEEKKIAGVLDALTRSKYIDEVICVDDNSSDSTLNIMRSFSNIKVIRFRKNHGKAYAIARGIEKATGDIVIFADADITGLTDEKILQLIRPLKSGKFDVAIGYRSSKVESTVGRAFSGERAYFKKDLLSHVKKFENKGYGLELYLNYHFKDKRVKVFKLSGVYSCNKHDKQPYKLAVRQYFRTTYQVMSEVLTQRNFVDYFIKSYISNFYPRHSLYLSQTKSLLKRYLLD